MAKKDAEKQAKVVNQSEATKRSAQDFAAAMRWASTIYGALRPSFGIYCDAYAFRRLKSLLLQVFQTIPKEHRGKRLLAASDLALLKGFNWNKEKKLMDLLSQAPVLTITGEGKATIALSANGMPFARTRPNATHVGLELMALHFDLQDGSFDRVLTHPLLVPVGASVPKATLSFSLDLKPACLVVCIAALYYENEGRRIGAKDSFAAQIVDAIHFSDGKVVVFDAAKPDELPAVEDEMNRIAWGDVIRCYRHPELVSGSLNKALSRC